MVFMCCSICVLCELKRGEMMHPLYCVFLVMACPENFSYISQSIEVKKHFIHLSGPTKFFLLIHFIFLDDYLSKVHDTLLCVIPSRYRVTTEEYSALLTFLLISFLLLFLAKVSK